MFFTKSSKQIESTRVVIIGTGSVGATSAYAILMQGIASEVVLIDVDKNKCQGEVWDLEHGLSFMPQARVFMGDYADCETADLVIITAGLKQKTGQSRLELTATNSKIIAEIVKNVTRYTKTAVILMVTNPLDVLTYVAYKTAGFPANQIFGTGTTLDSSRFRYLLAQSLGVAADSMGAYLIGEHGDSSVPVYSHANVMGENVANLSGYNKTVGAKAYQGARDAAANVICKKGSTFYAIGAAVARIARAVLYDENHVFPVSVLLSGQHGIKDVYLSLPAVIGRTGVKKILDIKLNAVEKNQLQKSAKIIQSTIDQIKL